MNRMKELRKEKKVTLIEMSKILKIPRSTLSRYENGDSEPKQKTWEELANYFDVPVAYLMGVSNQKIDDQKALEIAKNIYKRYLTDERLDEKQKKAVRYFNNENLDEVLKSGMRQYFAIPAVKENIDWQDLENNGFLNTWLDGYLENRYLKEVKTNQNLITNTYYSIPDCDEIDTYSNIDNEVQIPIDDSFLKMISSEIPQKLTDEIHQLKSDDTTLLISNYENAVSEELQKEINNILDEAREKISILKEKYPDNPNEIKQITALITNSRSGKYEVWSRVGEVEENDEINISEPLKEMFIQIGSEILEYKNNDFKETYK
ncbi:helix-turn-helix domain-containing protein [Enterococcus devriesei]|nr:helix-turn-helix transcriptional regulator [Enterococcus devriesei]